jgi:hypothetical protein
LQVAHESVVQLRATFSDAHAETHYGVAMNAGESFRLLAPWGGQIGYGCRAIGEIPYGCGHLVLRPKHLIPGEGRKCLERRNTNKNLARVPG